ncbi:MAG: prephenate/arogenate dehydrogenase family protein, partial [Pseudomonadota bacterium]
MTALFDTVCFVGIGLINSSLARAMRKHGLAGRIVALDVCEQARATALRLGVVDAVSADPAEVVPGAALVVVGTPVGAVEGVGRAIGPHLSPGAIVTDVGSVKLAVLRDLTPFLPEGVHFVPGHPIAGTEHSGPENGFAELFEGRWCILTPLPGTDQGAVDKVAEAWTRVGSMVEVMDPHHHDRVLAITSHLPHLIAYTIVGTANDLEGHLQQEVIKFSASGFRDFTRIAASDPIMWRDIFLNNREAVLEVIQRFTED